MKRSILTVCSLLLAAATAVAAVTAPYRIQFRDGRQVLAKDRPVRSGSVLLFHPYPRGVLTGVPIELVATVNAALAAGVSQTATVQVLNPGDVVILGPTGEGQISSGTEKVTAPAPGSATIPGGVYDPRMPIYGGNYGQPGGAARGNLTGLPSGDLARAQSGPPPTAQSPFAPNGFPANPAAPTTVIGPNGTPVMAPSGAPGSQQPVIGPNGTPILAPPGAPGSTAPPVGPNGYPAPTNPSGSSTSPRGSGL